MVKKLLWQQMVDKAIRDAKNDPYIASVELLQDKPVVAAKAFEEHIKPIEMRGWVFKLSQLIIDDLKQWHFSAKASPKDRDLSDVDLAFMEQIVKYVGVPKGKSVVLHSAQSMHFVWAETNTV